jgi:cytochrome c oxidase subunit 3
MPQGVELREPFAKAAQQREADLLGTCVFLTTEVMLFGGFFATALFLRIVYPEEYVGSSKALHLFVGGANTAVLLTSSLLVALAVQAARSGARRRAAILLAGGGLLGIAFLGIKAFEYSLEYSEGLLPIPPGQAHFGAPAQHLFMNLYLLATGLHAFHVAAGVLLLGGLAVSMMRGGLDIPGRSVVVEAGGLYWHMVDVIWVFLYPVLYLAR